MCLADANDAADGCCSGFTLESESFWQEFSQILRCIAACNWALHPANVASHTYRKAVATNLIGPLECDRKKVCQITFHVWPHLHKSCLRALYQMRSVQSIWETFRLVWQVKIYLGF